MLLLLLLLLCPELAFFEQARASVGASVRSQTEPTVGGGGGVGCRRLRSIQEEPSEAWKYSPHVARFRLVVNHMLAARRGRGGGRR